MRKLILAAAMTAVAMPIAVTPADAQRGYNTRREIRECQRELLDIVFTTGRRYLYHRVPCAEADAFRASFSKGRYFNARIRDRYDHSEVAA